MEDHIDKIVYIIIAIVISIVSAVSKANKKKKIKAANVQTGVAENQKNQNNNFQPGHVANEDQQSQYQQQNLNLQQENIASNQQNKIPEGILDKPDIDYFENRDFSRKQKRMIDHIVPEVTDSQNKDKDGQTNLQQIIGDETFDIRKAVIYSEIINRKYT